MSKPKDDRQKVELHPAAAKQLYSAADLLDAAVRELNEKKSACDHCGVMKYDQFGEYQMATELRAMSEKLARYASKLLGK